ncbi:hypothetical protein HOLleu_28746 [Holothuria leucospilota]|uniref:Retrotransposon gag domain-containing protein n=1 Tax=Holothuria leucospilota TaxID=206669 RepID=A0A9Q1H157_HOLLE|nr:hypothetical protein HOLleu_28746 [Holothuria leucospilota]
MKLYLDLCVSPKTEEEKCTPFLYVIGQEGRDIYNTITVYDNENNKIDVLFKKLEDYCKPKQNVTVERSKFNTRNQGPSESIDQYVTELRFIAKKCQFTTLEDELIRDCIKECLLRESSLTLTFAINICRAGEESSKQMKFLKDDANVGAVNTRNNK